MQKTKLVVSGIIVKDATYLLTRRVDKENPEFDGKWQFPGGGLEFAEHPEETLHRELREEVGVDVVNIELVPHIVTMVRNGNWQGIFLCYTGELKESDQEITLNEEASEYGWFSAIEIAKMNALAGVHTMIAYLEQQN